MLNLTIMKLLAKQFVTVVGDSRPRSVSTDWHPIHRRFVARSCTTLCESGMDFVYWRFCFEHYTDTTFLRRPVSTSFLLEVLVYRPDSALASEDELVPPY